ncbi:MAG: c-type cytochrome, partial [Pirellulales bacterium]
MFSHNELPGGGKVQGPMLEANQNSFQYLTEEDLYAIATYVKALEPRVAPKKASANPIAGVDPKVLDHYQTFCSGCHDMGSAGAPKFGNAAEWAGPIALGKETLYKNATNGIGGMPAKGLCAACTEEDIHALVD